LEDALQKNGYVVDRIGNIKALVRALASGKSWDIVFNVCEGLAGIGREAQVPALLEAYGIPVVFSPSEVMVVTMNKALAKQVVQEHGIATVPYKVIRNLSDLENFDFEAMPWPLFAKPLAEGTGKGIHSASVIHDKEQLERVCIDIIERFKQPALVETYLPGRELTVGIVGNGDDATVVGVLEAIILDGAEAGGQSFYNKENCEEVIEYRLVDDEVAARAASTALSSWRALGCLDAGRVDLRCDAYGEPNFLEVNPLAGLHPSHSDLPILAALNGIDHVSLIGKIMEAALLRYDMKVPEGVSAYADSCSL
ncbi:MAG TPA: D-alanine--D-alanine ligase, partial [Candidatus Melainabacteria bacterium]|nr:D-alanine--D-alanine ligase [Candidatus Melainabacteria bacterium]